jgi:hypothetical protein
VGVVDEVLFCFVMFRGNCLDFGAVCLIRGYG